MRTNILHALTKENKDLLTVYTTQHKMTFHITAKWYIIFQWLVGIAAHHRSKLEIRLHTHVIATCVFWHTIFPRILSVLL